MSAAMAPAPAWAPARHPLDPTRVLGDPVVGAALATVAASLRGSEWNGRPAGDDAGDDPVAVAFARGEPVRSDDLEVLVGAEGFVALAGAGALAPVPPDDAVRLTARLFPVRSLITLLPDPGPGLDHVYLGADSVLLFEIVWARIGVGDRAADLGTGNGFLAAALATRFDHVVATDLSARCVAAAACVTVLNPHLAGRMTTARTDVARGLRRRAFDVVTANAPWVPEAEGRDVAERVFAAGGPTGFELPRRFLDEAIELLAPGGSAFIACTDVALADGRRPLHEYLGGLGGRGVDVEVRPTRLAELHDMDAWVRTKNADAVSARHVVVVLRAP